MIDKKFCAQVCQQAQEPLIGTATRADLWCLLEYTGRWNEFAVRDSSLSPAVLFWYEQAQQQFPTFRLQFIKQYDSPLQTVTCFFAVTRPAQKILYRFQLKTCIDLLSIDLAALADDATYYEAYREQEPLFLICTHGKHDRCCAKFGLPLYSEVTRLAGHRAWQTTHIGGDKFAANLLCMPYGLYYGHVSRSDAQKIVHATYNQQVYADKYRGSSCYVPIVQAAEYFLRQQTGIWDLDAFALSQTEMLDNTLCTVTFTMRKTRVSHCLTVQTSQAQVTHHSSCHGLQTKNVTSYRLYSYTYQEVANDPRRESAMACHSQPIVAQPAFLTESALE